MLWLRDLITPEDIRAGVIEVPTKYSPEEANGRNKEIQIALAESLAVILHATRRGAPITDEEAEVLARAVSYTTLLIDNALARRMEIGLKVENTGDSNAKYDA